MSLAGKTIFITGASRGIGHAIALRAAQDGANIVIAAKTAEPHAVLPGTIHSAAADFEEAGGRALAIQCDIRDEAQLSRAVDEAVAHFGGLDVLVNNASAISLTGTAETDVKRFDLMHAVNARGTWLASKLCAPHLLNADAGGRILNIAPPLAMSEKWFRGHTAYTMAKYGMSMCVLGMAAEFQGKRIAVNALWPKTVIATAALVNLLGSSDQEQMKLSRTPEIMADAAHVVLTSDITAVTGNFLIDEDVLRLAGVTDFAKYATVPGTPDAQLMEDFFLDEDGRWPIKPEAAEAIAAARARL